MGYLYNLTIIKENVPPVKSHDVERGVVCGMWHRGARERPDPQPDPGRGGVLREATVFG